MRPRALLPVLAAAIASSLAACEPPPSATTADASVRDLCRGDDPGDPQLAALIEQARGHLADANVPGAAIAVVRGGDVEVVATGSKRPGECAPLTGDSRFFSLFGRHITGATVLAAAAAGEVDLDAPITAYLPTFAVAPPGDASAITLEHLLTGTSGFPLSHLNDCRDVDELLSLHRQLPLWAPPGRVYLALAFASGLAGNALGDYRAAARRHVIDPFGLTGSFDRVQALKGDVAIGARLAGDELRAVPFSLVECPISVPYLGYFTSARDAGRFIAALMAGDGDALAGRADAFYPPQRATATGFVRGPLAGDLDWLEGGGRTTGYAYAVRIVPELDFAALAFVNAGHGDPGLLAERAVAIFTGYERELELTPPDGRDFAALAGTYREPLGGTEIVVSFDGQSLTAQVQGSDPLPLSPGTRFGGYVHDLFAVEVGDTTHLLRFWRDDGGAGAIISENAFRAGLGPPFFRIE